MAQIKAPEVARGIIRYGQLCGVKSRTLAECQGRFLEGRLVYGDEWTEDNCEHPGFDAVWQARCEAQDLWNYLVCEAVRREHVCPPVLTELLGLAAQVMKLLEALREEPIPGGTS
jgi:hypothetical protein